MRVLAGVLGALLGLVVGLALVEWIFANDQSWPDVVPFALAAAGWLIGRAVVRRRAVRRPPPPVSRPL